MRTRAVNERAKEELSNGRSHNRAIDEGYRACYMAAASAVPSAMRHWVKVANN